MEHTGDELDLTCKHALPYPVGQRPCNYHDYYSIIITCVLFFPTRPVAWKPLTSCSARVSAPHSPSHRPAPDGRQQRHEKKSSVARCLVLSLLYQLEGVFACHGHRQVVWGRGSTRGMWPATAQLLRNSGAGQVGKTVINSLLLGSGGTLTTFACVYGEGVWEKKIK